MRVNYRFGKKKTEEGFKKHCHSSNIEMKQDEVRAETFTIGNFEYKYSTTFSRYRDRI